MMENEAISHLILTIDLGEQIDLDELDRQTRKLRDELWDLGIESASLLRKPDLVEGKKSAEAVTLGALTLAILPEVLPKLLSYLQSWTMREDHRKVKVKTQIGDRTIELEYAPSNLSAKELKVLVDTLTGALSEG